MKPQRAKVLLFSILLMGFITLTGCSHHGNRHRSDNHNFSNHADRITQELELSQNQEKQLEVLISNLEDKRAALAKGHTVVEEVFKQLSAEQFDEQYITNAISEYLDEVEEISLDFVIKLSELHNTLTNKQRIKLAQHLPSTERERYHRHW